MLPVNYPFEKAAEAVHRLNQLEHAAMDAPPYFGAWGVEPNSGMPTFVCFWPNALYAPGTSTNIAVWMAHRSRIAKTWLEPREKVSSLALRKALLEGGEEGLPEGVSLGEALDQRILDRFPGLTRDKLARMMKEA